MRQQTGGWIAATAGKSRPSGDARRLGLPAAKLTVGIPLAQPTKGAAAPTPVEPIPPETAPAAPMHRPARYVWALLLARIYEVLPLLCPNCGGAMRIIAFITEAVVIREILGHLREPTSPPRLMPARGPPLGEMPDSDPDAADPRAQPQPDYELDQRIAWWGNRRQDSLVGGDSCLKPPERQNSAAQVATGTDNGHAGARFQRRSGVRGAKSTIDPDGYGRITATMALEFLSFERRMQAAHLGRFFEMARAVQVGAVQERHELRMFEVILPGEGHQPADRLGRIDLGQAQRLLGFADMRVSVFEHRKEQVVLVAEVVVQHALVGIRLGGEFGLGRLENERARALRVVHQPGDRFAARGCTRSKGSQRSRLHQFIVTGWLHLSDGDREATAQSQPCSMNSVSACAGGLLRFERRLTCP